MTPQNTHRTLSEVSFCVRAPLSGVGFVDRLVGARRFSPWADESRVEESEEFTTVVRIE
jgi:hypothetical protein